MATYQTERVLTVTHWNESLFSFTTTRNQSLRFRNGHFLMIGLEIDGRPLDRAYSVVSPNYAEHLEFFSIKVPNGPLTSFATYSGRRLYLGEREVCWHISD